MASNEQIAKDFVESTINDNKHILDQVSPLPSPQSPVAPPPPTHSPPAPPARNPPNEMSEEEIHEKTNRLVERMFAFANETTKKKKGGVENKQLELFIINEYIDALDTVLDKKLIYSKILFIF